MSMQDRRYVLGKVIDRQLFFERFVGVCESGENSYLIQKSYQMNNLGNLGT